MKGENIKSPNIVELLKIAEVIKVHAAELVTTDPTDSQRRGVQSGSGSMLRSMTAGILAV